MHASMTGAVTGARETVPAQGLDWYQHALAIRACEAGQTGCEMDTQPRARLRAVLLERRHAEVVDEDDRARALRRAVHALAPAAQPRVYLHGSIFALTAMRLMVWLTEHLHTAVNRDVRQVSNAASTR